MLRTRNQGEDSMFRWARTEMKREIVMSQSSYAKIAGLQSEIGRVVVTRVAGSELEYKRVLNMYRKDMTCSVNNIRREQVKMKLRMGRYVKKLKQTKIENAKRLKEEQRRDKERAELEELHLRLKQEANGKPPEHSKTHNELPQISVDEFESAKTSPSDIELKEGTMYLQTGVVHEAEEDFWKNDNDGESTVLNNHKRKSRVESHPFSPMLPMINEDAEKETDATDDVDDKKVAEIYEDVDDQAEKLPSQIMTDETLSVSSFGGRKKKKKDVSFSDIIKLKYSGTKHLFDLVHILAKKHGIPDVVEKVPDPRDNVVLRGSTNDSLRLQAAVLYPMKYGYSAESDEEIKEIQPVKSPTVSNNITESDSEVYYDSDRAEEIPKHHRKLSLEQRRAIYMSGRHSKSVNDGDNVSLPELGETPESMRKSKSRDRGMPELVEKVSRLKLEQFERSYDRLGSGTRMLSPHKPSSSRSSRSLPTALKHSGKAEDKVSWTQAFGLLRAIHSLEDISG